MAERAVAIDPFTSDDEWKGTDYLIAISPDLQKAHHAEKQQKTALAQREHALLSLENRADYGHTPRTENRGRDVERIGRP